MSRWLIDLLVEYKPGVLDPQAQSIAAALSGLGYEGVDQVTSGKRISFSLEAGSEEQARQQAEQACQQFLVNPVLEQYQLCVSAAPREQA